MPPDGSPYGHVSTSASIQTPEPVIDLDECIREELARQAGLHFEAVPLPPFLKTELLLHQKKNLRRMIELEAAGCSILQMDAIGMGKTLQTLCLIVSALDKRACNPIPGSNLPYYKAPRRPAARTRWDDVRRSRRLRRPEAEAKVYLSKATLIIVQKAHLGHWMNEIHKHFDLPAGYVISQDLPNPKSAKELIASPCQIILVSREAITGLYDEAAWGWTKVWLFRMRFVRLVLDEGASSTGSTEKSLHALMTQAIHADSKVLIDATPYTQGDSPDARRTKLRELGVTRAFFSAVRSFEELERQWETRVVRAKEGAATAKEIVQQFLKAHLVQSQPEDRPQLPPVVHVPVPLRYNDEQAFAYNRLLFAIQLALVRYKGSMSDRFHLKECCRKMADILMDTFSCDLVCNTTNLLKAYNLSSLLASEAFKHGQADIKRAERLWDAFERGLLAAGVPPARVAQIAELLRFHDDESSGAAATAPRACARCARESFVPVIVPVCGHVICTQCLLAQKRAQQRAARPNRGSGPVFLRDEWTDAALKALRFECGCAAAFSWAELGQHPMVCVVPHGLSYKGSPKLKWILDFVKKHPQEKTLIYLADKRHRDSVANHFHAQGVQLADFSRSGSPETAANRAEPARLIEAFKKPLGAASGSAFTPVFVALAAGTSASTGVRALDLHMLQHILIIGQLKEADLAQLIGRGNRIGQRGVLQAHYLYMEGSFEDKKVHRPGSAREERLLSARPLEGTGEAEVDPAFKEAFPFNKVVWVKRGAGRAPAQVRPSPHTYILFGQRGKIHVKLFGSPTAFWALPDDLSLFNEDEASLQNLDAATRKAIGRKQCDKVCRAALAEARRTGQLPAAKGGSESAGAGGGGSRSGCPDMAEPRWVEFKGDEENGREEDRRRETGRGPEDEPVTVSVTEVLTPEERERRRKGKRKVGVSLDDEIDMQEEETPALVRRKRPNTRRKEGFGIGTTGSGHVAEGVRSDAGRASVGESEGGHCGETMRRLRLGAPAEQSADGTEEQSTDCADARTSQGARPGVAGAQSPGAAAVGGTALESPGRTAAETGELSDEDGFESGRVIGQGRNRRRYAVHSEDEDGTGKTASPVRRFPVVDEDLPAGNDDPPAGTHDLPAVSSGALAAEAANGGTPVLRPTVYATNGRLPRGPSNFGEGVIPRGNLAGEGAVAFAPVSPPPQVRSAARPAHISHPLERPLVPETTVGGADLQPEHDPRAPELPFGGLSRNQPGRDPARSFSEAPTGTREGDVAAGEAGTSAPIVAVAEPRPLIPLAAAVHTWRASDVTDYLISTDFPQQLVATLSEAGVDGPQLLSFDDKQIDEIVEMSVEGRPVVRMLLKSKLKTRLGALRSSNM